MNDSKKDKLAREFDQLRSKGLFPIVPLEEFFEGNKDAQSIWWHQDESPEDYFRVLRKLRDRPDVFDVRIVVEGSSVAEGAWPSSGKVLIVTSEQNGSEIIAWFGRPYWPDGLIEKDPILDASASNIAIPANMRRVWAWWD